MIATNVQGRQESQRKFPWHLQKRRLSQEYAASGILEVVKEDALGSPLGTAELNTPGKLHVDDLNIEKNLSSPVSIHSQPIKAVKATSKDSALKIREKLFVYLEALETAAQTSSYFPEFQSQAHRSILKNNGILEALSSMSIKNASDTSCKGSPQRTKRSMSEGNVFCMMGNGKVFADQAQNDTQQSPPSAGSEERSQDFSFFAAKDRNPAIYDSFLIRRPRPAHSPARSNQRSGSPPSCDGSSPPLSVDTPLRRTAWAAGTDCDIHSNPSGMRDGPAGLARRALPPPPALDADEAKTASRLDKAPLPSRLATPLSGAAEQRDEFAMYRAQTAAALAAGEEVWL